MTRRGNGTFTGRHMLAIVVAFFGTIIAVNLTMAMVAGRSWTGLVVKNSYVASQEFNRKAEQGRAQAALGWHSSLTIGSGEIRYRLADASGATVAPSAVTVTFRRPAYDGEDKVIAMQRRADGTFRAPETPRDGIWIVETDAEVGRDLPYREVSRIVVTAGELE
ncbi:FixH family protein [Mesorhizobium sp. L-8-3]|uniref:FixH family protein n=1 Tax=Mesorhizobium sp. L-8-3 TaxID=2744522 RepID=UPI001926FD1E|nr:FixH family protein [Mesorhizobium sp. L-8-3]BCH25295.1 cytochrome oxidase [Mesorhizobium sp. L-8-3]